MKTNPKDKVTKKYVRDQLEKLLQVSGLMSNVCFNLKHKAKLDFNDRESLAKIQFGWDDAKSKLPAWMWRKQKGSGVHG